MTLFLPSFYYHPHHFHIPLTTLRGCFNFRMPVFAWCFVLQTCLCLGFSPFDVLHMYPIFSWPILVKSVTFFLLVDDIPISYVTHLCSAFFYVWFHLHLLERRLLQGGNSTHLHSVNARAFHTYRPSTSCILDMLDSLCRERKGKCQTTAKRSWFWFNQRTIALSENWSIMKRLREALSTCLW